MHRSTWVCIAVGAVICMIVDASLQPIVPRLDAFFVSIIAGYGAMIFTGYLLTVYGKTPKP